MSFLAVLKLVLSYHYSHSILTLEVRPTRIGDQGMVESRIQKRENELAGSDEWNNAAVTITVVDESTDTVIEG